MPRRANPRLQSPQMFSRSARSKSSEEFLEELERLARLNRGGFSTFADESGYQPGFIVPGATPVRQGQFVPDIAGQTRQTQATPPTYPDIPESINYSPEIGPEPQPAPEGSVEEFQEMTQALMSYPVSQTDDGGLLMSNGTVVYEDGSVRQATQQDVPQVLAELSDGSVMLTDGTIVSPTQQIGRAYSGVSGLSELLFGRQQKITQEYGNYNPKFYKSGYHSGVDFRTRDLDQNFNFTLPFDAQIVDIKTAASGSPYGNSVLLQLPDGSMMRLSHLSDIINAQPGTTIRAFDYIGTPGNTGLSTGEHLDVEYFNSDGQRVDPATFMFNAADYVDEGLIKEAMTPDLSNLPEQEREFVRQQREYLQQNPDSPMTLDPNQIQAPQQQDTLLDSVRQARESGDSILDQITSQPITETAQDITQAVGQVPQRVQEAAQPMSPERQQLASGVEDVAQRAGLQAEGGLSELTEQGKGERGQRSPAMQARVSALGRQPDVNNPYRQFLGNVTERVGDTLGVPEGSLSETIAGGPTKRTNVALASEIGSTRPEQVPGIRQNLRDIGQDLQARAGRAAENVGAGVRGGLENARSKVKKFIEELQPGAGVERLKQGDSKSGGANANLFSRKKPEQMSPDRVVGKSSGGNLLAGGPSQGIAAARAKADTSDPFFKSPLFQKVKGFTNIAKNEPIRDQALSQDIFVDEFYDQPERVSGVFGQTYMREPALKKATQRVKDQYRQRFSGSEWDQGDVERILQSLPDTLNYTPNLPQPKKKKRTTLAEYLARGGTLARWYARTGQQSKLDSMGGPDSSDFKRHREEVLRSIDPDPVRSSGYSADRGWESSPSPADLARSGRGSDRGSKTVRYSSGRTVKAAPGTSFRADSQGSVQQVRENKPPVKSRSAQVTSGDNSGGLFNRAKKFVGGIFNRFFN